MAKAVKFSIVGVEGKEWLLTARSSGLFRTGYTGVIQQWTGEGKAIGYGSMVLGVGERLTEVWTRVEAAKGKAIPFKLRELRGHPFIFIKGRKKPIRVNGAENLKGV